MARHNDLGRQGEQIAADYLRKKGYTILKQNWFYEKYEIDIIASNKEYIIFVEVKTRASDMWGNPEEAISANKIKKIVDAADFYIRENDTDLEIRFDVIAVIMGKGNIEIEHFEDAFLPPVN